MKLKIFTLSNIIFCIIDIIIYFLLVKPQIDILFNIGLILAVLTQLLIIVKEKTDDIVSYNADDFKAHNESMVLSYIPPLNVLILFLLIGEIHNNIIDIVKKNKDKISFKP